MPKPFNAQEEIKIVQTVENMLKVYVALWRVIGLNFIVSSHSSELNAFQNLDCSADADFPLYGAFFSDQIQRYYTKTKKGLSKSPKDVG